LRIPAALGLALACLLAACPLSRAQTQGPHGAELAGRLGCLACHSLKGQGGKLATPLDGVGARLTPQELGIALAYPRRRHPRAKMPSYAYLPPLEQAALVEFLQTLK
jgi:mono/diheme cytochrome c family protein